MSSFSNWFYICYKARRKDAKRHILKRVIIDYTEPGTAQQIAKDIAFKLYGDGQRIIEVYTFDWRLLFTLDHKRSEDIVIY